VSSAGAPAESTAVAAPAGDVELPPAEPAVDLAAGAAQACG
jgi:hypothetical protein